jgi:hypothetical protein
MHPIDVVKMGTAFERPGMDTRRWFMVGVIKAIRVDASGKYADVDVFTPEPRPETVLIGAGGGQGGGLHLPYSVGDLVVVAFPDGNSDAGGVIVCGFWDPGQPPPDVVVENPTDGAWVARPGRTLRLVATEDGLLILRVEDGQVRLGDELASRGVARISDSVQVTIPPNTVIVQNPLFPGVPPGSQPEFIPNPLPITLEGLITSASTAVRSR